MCKLRSTALSRRVLYMPATCSALILIHFHAQKPPPNKPSLRQHNLTVQVGLAVALVCVSRAAKQQTRRAAFCSEFSAAAICRANTPFDEPKLLHDQARPSLTDNDRQTVKNPNVLHRCSSGSCGNALEPPARSCLSPPSRASVRCRDLFGTLQGLQPEQIHQQRYMLQPVSSVSTSLCGMRHTCRASSSCCCCCDSSCCC